MIDHLRQMAIFAKAIDHGSFRGAAPELRLSPSVVSHHISQLEDHLGVALIYRSTRKLTLTREGERLLTATRKMLEAAEGELLNLAVSANEPSGNLRLTLPSVLSQSDFTDRIAAFAKSYPRISLTLDFSDVKRELIAGGFDIAIRMGPNAKNAATCRRLFQVQRRLIATPEFVAANAPATEPQQIAEWTWLALTPAQNAAISFRRATDGLVRSIKPKAMMQTNDAQAMYRLARAGTGLAIVPEFLAKEDAAAGIVEHVLPDWTIAPLEVFAVWPANAPKHGLIHLALDALSF
jgi:DNA-binding transcriptional LysR family regulator